MDDPTLPLVEERNNTAKIRDESGKFLPGNPGSPGRPPRKTLTELIHAKLDSTPDGWDNIVAIALSLITSKKDKEILKELWHYTDGMPKESHDVTQQGGFTVILKREP